MSSCGSCGSSTLCSTHDGRAALNNCVSDPCLLGQGQQYFPEQFLNQMAGNLFPALTVFKNWHSSIMQFFFDRSTLGENINSVTPQLVFKNLASVKLGDFVDGNYVQRWEWYYKKFEWVVTADYATPTLTFTVWLPDGSGGYINTTSDATTGYGIHERATILIARQGDDPCCTDNVIRTVVSVTPTTVTLEQVAPGDTGITLREGDTVKVLWKSRNDCEVINNKYGKTPALTERSYAQHFGYRLEFKKCDVNKAYLSPEGAMAPIKNLLFHNNIGLAEEMGFAALFARNRGCICAGASELPSETQGLISKILVEDARDPSLGLISSVRDYVTIEQKVQKLFCEIYAAQQSGVLNPGETLTILANTEAMTALAQRQFAFNKVLGYQVLKSDGQNNTMSFPTIATPNGGVEFEQDQLLSEAYPNEGVLVIFPKRLLSITARQNYRYNPLANSIEKSSLGLMMEEVTMPGQHECREYDVWTEFALIIAGARSGAYRMIMGIHSSC